MRFQADSPSSASDALRTLFDQLAQMPPERRRQFLDEQSLDSPTRGELESLLAALDDAGGFLGESGRRAVSDPDFATGTRIDNYELGDLIGEGGFACVFRARQLRPVRRDVAMKIIKLGMDTRAVIARFELERQALAMMDHPNIAAVHDAGATATGRPYFVMELVRGPRITRYCDEQHLTVRQRLELFIDACHGVHHAHQKGILHRDLKPSNILVETVDDRPLPKIIDFGIAKAVQGRITEATIVTQAQQMLGTPQYMSPEQALSGGTDVDTRSDVYSLGAVLFEVLTGSPPLDLPAGGSSQLDSLNQLTSNRDMPRASTRAADPQLRRTLRGELDWIVGKCLEKDRTRRYESAAALASDLGAYLQHRPIVAAPPTTLYRATKFVQRNTIAVVAAGIILVTLLAGSIVSTMQAIRATRAERLAQKALQETREANANLTAVNEFLTRDMIGAADPAVHRGQPMSVLDALDNAAKAVPLKFRDRPLTEATVRESVAWAYLALGEADLALPHSMAAMEQRKRILGEDNPQTIQSIDIYAAVLKSKGQLAESEALLAAALEKSRRINGEDHPTTIEILDSYATVLTSQGKWSQSQPLAKAAMEQARRVHGEGHFKTLSTMSNYARVLYQMGRNAEAEPLLKEAMDQSVRINGEDHPESIAQMNNLATTLSRLGRFSEAEPLSQRSLDLRRQVFGEDHPLTLLSRDTHAGLLFRMGKFEESARIYKDVIERARVKEGEEHPSTLTAMNNYAVVLQVSNRAAEAEALLVQVLERRRRTQGPNHPDTLTALANYARAMQGAGNPAGAEPILREALEQQRLLLGADHPSALGSLHNYADLLRVLGRAAEAEPFAKEAMERFRRTLGEQHPSALSSMNNYIAVLAALGRDRDAEPICAELYQKAAAAAQLPKTQAAIYMANCGPCLVRLGRYADAEGPLMEAHRRLTETNQRTTPRMRQVLESLAEVCDKTNRPDEAARWRAQHAATQPSTRPTTAPNSTS